MTARRAFVVAHTAQAPVPFVPEVTLHLATEVTPLWHATQAWLDARDVPPPFWAFAWAGGQGLARYLLDHPEITRGRSVLDLASGSGLVAIAAALAGAARVRAVDSDPFAIEAIALNAAASGVSVEGVYGDATALEASDADVVLAGDVFYERAMAERFAARLAAFAHAGLRVLAGDPGRAYAPPLREVARYDVPVLADLEGVGRKRVSVLAFDR